MLYKQKCLENRILKSKNIFKLRKTSWSSRLVPDMQACHRVSCAPGCGGCRPQQARGLGVRETLNVQHSCAAPLGICFCEKISLDLSFDFCENFGTSIPCIKKMIGFKCVGVFFPIEYSKREYLTLNTLL